MHCLVSSSRSKTFKPQKNFKNETARFSLHKKAHATLGAVDLHAAVQLPEGEDLNEWLAVNVVEFFNTASLIYGTISEFCTDATCPCMSAGPKYMYYWQDGAAYKKPTEVSAPTYIDLLMTWIEEQLSDETMFPSDTAVPFPKDYLKRVKNIFKRLFRVYAHIYYCHFREIEHLGAEAHLNTCFKHFYYYVREFDLMTAADLEPLQELIDNRGLDNAAE